jgi:pantoate--beta-alanine ligase
MERVTSIADLRERVAAARAAGRRVGLVPTMGALHAGHLSLVSHCRTLADLVVVSIFVNPTQFGPGEDLEAYPRDLDGDQARLAALGPDAPDLLFAPSAAEMYPAGLPPRTRVHVAGLTEHLCGRSRPGHFDGVALVVTKLHGAVAPDVAVYGRKDYQQLRVIQQVAADLNQPVEVVGGPTVREPDGLAMSSRNAYLDPTQREAARVLSRGLRAGVVAARTARADGVRPDAGMIREAVRVTIAEEPQARIDYVDVVDVDTLAPPDARRREQEPGPGSGSPPAPPDHTTGEARWLAAVAVHVGPARLIDNVVIGDPDDEDRLLAATA